MPSLTEPRVVLRRFLVSTLIVIGWLAAAPVVSAAIFTVTTLNDSGPGSLRQALLDAAANGAGPFDDIRFAISGPGPHVIVLASELPGVPTRVLIDGYTQPGARANTLQVGNDAIITVRIDGSGTLGTGLTLSGHSIAIRGLSITRFLTAGVGLPGAVGTNLTIEGNFIGLAPGGVSGGNGVGIALGSTGGGPTYSVIGGASPQSRNVIAANLNEGISVSNAASDIRIQGNYIGTDAGGMAALGNGVGVRFHGPGGSLGARNTIGGGLPILGNVISGNNGDGIVLSDARSAVVSYNIIGSAADGASLLWSPSSTGWASLGHGISVEGAGGQAPTGHTIDNNLIRSNRFGGVRIVTGVGTVLRQNRIFWNGGHDIDLGGDSVTANDPGDIDSGPNELQNFPVITSVVPIGFNVMHISGTLDSTPNSTFRVEVFSNQGCDDSMHGGGQVFGDAVDVTTGPDGLAAFTVYGFRSASAAHNLATATATSASGSTSEFSECVFLPSFSVDMTGTVTAGGIPLAGVLVTLSGSSSGTQTTGADGRYAFTRSAGMPYTITPTLARHVFTPASTSTTPTFDVTANFAATRLLQITGVVRDLNGTPLPGVDVTLGGGQTATAITDAGGRYTFSALAPGAAYDVGVTRAGFTFTPALRAFGNLQDDVTGESASFTATTGAFRRYFAEGATGFFDTSFALLNATDTPANVLLRFQKGDGTSTTHPLTMVPRSRATIAPKAIAGLASAEFSTVVESDVPLVADRTMTWDATGYGSHAETSIAAPSLTWYLAEGATIGGFNLFYLLQNPSNTAAEVKVTYLRPAPAAAIERTYVIAASSRFNVWVNVEDPALAAAEVSAVIDVLNGVPIIVERAMYRDGAGETFRSGHASAGIPAPASTWFLAEGATGQYFDLFVLIANPGATDAQRLRHLPASRRHTPDQALRRSSAKPLQYLGGRRRTAERFRPAASGQHRGLHHDHVHQRRAAHCRAVDVVAGSRGHVARGTQQRGRDGERDALGAGRGRPGR